MLSHHWSFGPGPNKASRTNIRADPAILPQPHYAPAFNPDLDSVCSCCHRTNCADKSKFRQSATPPLYTRLIIKENNSFVLQGRERVGRKAGARCPVFLPQSFVEER